METSTFSKDHSETPSYNFQKSQNQLEYIGKKEDTEDDISSSTKIQTTSPIQEKSSQKKMQGKKKKKEAKKAKKNKEDVTSDESNEIKEIIDDNSKDNADDMDEISQNKNDSLPPEKKDKKKGKSEKSEKKEALCYRGYSAFSFFEKEKFKEHDNKDISGRDFVKQISLQWKNMSDAEKEPYIKLFLDFKNNNNFPEQPKLIKKKRKRITSPSCGKCVKSKKGKISANKNEAKKNSFSTDKKIDLLSSDSESEKSKNEKAKDNYEEIANDYFMSVVVPLVEISYKFFKDKGIIDSK